MANNCNIPEDYFMLLYVPWPQMWITQIVCTTMAMHEHTVGTAFHTVISVPPATASNVMRAERKGQKQLWRQTNFNQTELTDWVCWPNSSGLCSHFAPFPAKSCISYASTLLFLCMSELPWLLAQWGRNL